MDSPKRQSHLRREQILHILKASSLPIKGGELANQMNVSRQVIVGDISLLKATNEPIIATSQGYIYIQKEETRAPATRLIVSKHSKEQTKDELFTIVDHGVTIKDVTVEHPVYGDLTASLRLTSRKDVEQFLAQLSHTNATLLSTLTDGVHMHLLEASSMEIIERACEDLQAKGYLLQNGE
ncbi:transcriptional regulator [Fictibacillus macauensis ZFHKF-1]|uniref:Transcriptional regulator n=1 Tax=Fictibacillus macauensis ZFHKF-1 TaxID=1196324 RepID=I8UES8_9BACL|nr:transcription repressor NadR [Fictibacillus macauensis]EIT85328.1 transcriptional regulator [Fictibacillus macauensis ZFHKF-1]